MRAGRPPRNFYPISIDFRRPKLVTASDLDEPHPTSAVFQLRLQFIESRPNVFLLDAFQHFAQPLDSQGSVGDE